MWFQVEFQDTKNVFLKMAIFTGDFTCNFSSILTLKYLFTTRQILSVQVPLNPNYAAG